MMNKWNNLLILFNSFFCDAYDLFIINLVVPMIGYVYYSGHGILYIFSLYYATYLRILIIS